MQRRFVLLALAPSLFALACSGTVVVVGTDGGEGSTGTTGSGGAPVRAVAWRADQAPYGGAVTTGGAFPDPDALHVFVSSDALACGATLVDMQCAGAAKWEIDFLIPPADLHPGTLDLESTEMAALVNWALPANANGPVNCAGGVDVGARGHVEIVTVDDTAITLRFHDATGLGDEDPIDVSDINDVDFVAPRCAL